MAASRRKYNNRTLTKTSHKKPLQTVEGHLCFYLVDGRVLQNLRQLSDALTNIHEDVFKHHVNSERNDFSNWAKDVFQEKSLSNQLKLCKTPVSCQRVLGKYLKNTF